MHESEPRATGALVPTLQEFCFDEATIRVVIGEEGEPWFVASDVCAALDISNHRMAVSRLDDDERGISSIDSLGGVQSTLTVNESGLYNLILTSRKPEAKRFKKWVTSQVLPAIRKTGGYGAFPVPKTLSEALRLAADIEDKRAALVAENAVLRPKAELTDRISTASGLKSIQEVAKILGYGPNNFFALLRGEDIFYRQDGVNLPAQRYVDAGYFCTREYLYHDGEATRLYTRIFVTGRGELWLARRLSEGQTNLASNGEAL